MTRVIEPPKCFYTCPLYMDYVIYGAMLVKLGSIHFVWAIDFDCVGHREHNPASFIDFFETLIVHSMRSYALSD